jgi:hypothetical protein
MNDVSVVNADYLQLQWLTGTGGGPTLIHNLYTRLARSLNIRHLPHTPASRALPGFRLLTSIY